MPQCFDRRDLCEEAVAADIKPIAFVPRGASEAADYLVGFEHRHRGMLPGEKVGRREPARACADDDDSVSGTKLSDRTPPVELLGRHRWGSRRIAASKGASQASLMAPSSSVMATISPAASATPRARRSAALLRGGAVMN